MQYLVEHQISITHSVIIRADACDVYAALASLEGIEDPLMGALIWLRHAPQRLGLSNSGPSPRAFSLSAFLVLHRSKHHLALGMAGKFWKAKPCTAEIADVDAFLAFNEPGTSKLVMCFDVEVLPDAKVRLTTHTHIYSPDHGTRARMALYWMMIRPGIEIMRRRLLWLIKTGAEERT